jgi:hypothetical protein
LPRDTPHSDIIFSIAMPHLSPVLLSDERIVAAYAVFLEGYFVFALGKSPG